MCIGLYRLQVDKHDTLHEVQRERFLTSVIVKHSTVWKRMTYTCSRMTQVITWFQKKKLLVLLKF